MASDRKPTGRPQRGSERKRPSRATTAVKAPPAPAAVVAKPRRRRRRAIPEAKFRVGQVVRHRYYPFRGVIFDVDPVFANTEAWWESIPAEIRPEKNQPFYHLLAENAETEYVAYVSEQNLLPDESGQPLRHPQVKELFKRQKDGSFCALYLDLH
jgi:heat shock protein HspQ